MKTAFTQQQLKEIENQLSFPTGEKGIEIGVLMHQNNIGMTKSAINFLHLKNNEKVLEIGHGNCGHLNYLLTKATNLEYTGIDVSQTMKKEAEKQISKLNSNQVDFKLYDGNTFPFKENYFDKIFSVNTIYFWKNPKETITEITRILKPNGTIAITFAQKEFMKNLPFVGEKFQLYNTFDFKEIIKETSLFILDFIDKEEFIKSKSGEDVLRKYTTVILKNKQ